MRWIRWIAAAAGVVVILIAAAVAYIATLDLNAYKGDIQSALERATGRGVVIAGDIGLAWKPGPSLAASGVRIANAEWGSEPSMATVGELAVGVELLPLLSGRAEVRELHLAEVRLLLERDADGRGNWELGGGSAGGSGDGGGAVPSIRHLDLTQAAVIWKSGPKAPEQVYRIERLSLTGGGPEASFAMTLAAELDGDPLELEGTVPGPAAFLRPGAALPVDLQGSFAGTPLALAATLQAEGDGRRLRVDRVEAAFGDLAVSGSATVDLDGKRPRIEASLEADTVDLAKLGDGEGVGDPLDRPLPVDLLTAVDGKLQAKVGRLIAGGVAVDALTATATLADGVLTLDPVDGQIAEGPVSGRAVLDGSKRPARLALTGTAGGMNMGTVYRALMDEALVEGRGDAFLDLRGRGDTPRSLLGSADGVGRLVVRDGMIQNKYWELIAEDVATRFLPFIGEADRGRLNCLVGRFDIAKGIADATVLMVDSQRVTVAGEGTIDLAAQTLDMRLVPRPKDPSLFSLATPILLTGPVADPRPAPDPVAIAKGLGGLAAGAALGPVGLLLPFVSSGSADKPCPDAIAAAEGKRPLSGSNAGKEQEGKSGGIKGLFEGLRKAIE